MCGHTLDLLEKEVTLEKLPEKPPIKPNYYRRCESPELKEKIKKHVSRIWDKEMEEFKTNPPFKEIERVLHKYPEEVKDKIYSLVLCRLHNTKLYKFLAEKGIGYLLRERYPLDPTLTKDWVIKVCANERARRKEEYLKNK